MEKLIMKIFDVSVVILSICFVLPLSHGYTYEQDVYAINNLYIALGSPPLPGWIPSGGDPCVESWQGVLCVNANITSITLTGANLGGQLGNKLENFSSIITIDLSNNNIGGNIPLNLPVTLQRFFLSANQLMGGIPSSLSTLIQLTALSLNNNLLTGELPDSFQALTSLANLDLSFNNLSGQLPSSLEYLLSLTTLHVQNNSLTGRLDVLQNLSLQELNIENNLFWGPVPEKILSIPNFKKDGNPFNTTIAPSISPPSPQAVYEVSPSQVTLPPSKQDDLHASRKFWTSGKIIAAVIVVVLLCSIFVLVVVCCLRCLSRSKDEKVTKSDEIVSFKVPGENQISGSSVDLPSNETSKLQLLEQSRDQVMKVQKEVKEAKDDHGMDMTGLDIILIPPPTEKISVKHIVPSRSSKTISPPTSVKAFTVATLQEYTNSFRQENLIGRGMLGNVYRAELPGALVMAVKKLDISSPNLQSDEAFLELVSSISKLHHKNVVKLEGYCVEYGQRLLVYEYCSYGTLYEALHSDDDEINRKLSWDARLQIALGVARALEYLHEACEPPIVHRNFKSANVLLDDKLSARVSDCGLGLLVSTASVSQLADHLHSFSYNDPVSVQTETYTSHSDVYSFGVVMLELFTGRKPYDSSCPRGEQFLVEWAKHQLHDFTSLQKMVDPSLSGTYTLKSMSKFADVISLCVQTDPGFRPPMSDIVQRLLDMLPSRRLESSSKTQIKNSQE